NYGPGCCGNERSARDLTVEFSIDGVNFTPVGDFTLLRPADDVDPFPGQNIQLSGDARWVKLDLHNNYGDISFVGLSEVKFFGSSGVPEPASWALLVFGLAGIGAVLRRRREILGIA